MAAKHTLNPSIDFNILARECYKIDAKHYTKLLNAHQYSSLVQSSTFILDMAWA